MNFAIQRCCTTPVFLKQYEDSTDAVFNKLGINTVDIEEFNCCGYPLKNYNFKAYVLSATRNIALAEKRNMNILTICNCCYGNLKKANHLMKENNALNDEINKKLNKEGLSYQGQVEIKHFLEILYQDIGIERINEMITRRFKNIKIALHYGCHILRPRQLAEFDAPGTVSILNQLVEITGAEIINWRSQKECCGSPMWGIDDDLSSSLTKSKIEAAKQAGADYLCSVCPYCQLQFDRVQKMITGTESQKEIVPSVLYTQLLGLCLGIDEDRLGIHENELMLKDLVSSMG